MKKVKTTSSQNFQKDAYTPTEVGTMLEAIHKDIQTVAEGHSSLDRRMEKLEMAVQDNTLRADRGEVRLSAIEFRLTRVENNLEKTRGELKAEIRALGNRLEGVESRG